MNLNKILKSSRCGKCRQERGHRFCLRRGHSIGWHCCNEIRVDRKCPESCNYAISQKEDTLFLKAKADSQNEFTDLIKKEMDFWIRNPQPVVNNQIPMLMKESQEGRNELDSLFSKLNIPDFVPLAYLQKRLGLKNLKKETCKTDNPEEKAETYLECLLQHDFEATVPLLYNRSVYDDKDYLEAFLKRMTQHKILRKMIEYSLISCATSEDKKQALIHFEINRKYDLTLLLKRRETWLIAAKVFGDPKHALAENEANKQLAVLLSKKEYEKFLQLIEKYSAIYVDSADMHYYWSIYYTMNEQKDKAKEYLRTAIELDSDFTDAKYNYAFLMHIDNQLAEAEKWYRNILESEPNDVKTLNNLASILIDRGEEIEAKPLLKKCVKIKPDFEIALQNLNRIGE